MGIDDLAPRGKPRKPVDGVQDAQVHRVDGATVMVVLPFVDGGVFEYGPAPWPQGVTSDADTHVHDLPAPTVGLWCVVAFVGGDVDQPRVLAAYPGWEPT